MNIANIMKKYLSIVLSIFFILSILFSYEHISHGMEHNHEIDRVCYICESIENCIEIIQGTRIIPVFSLIGIYLVIYIIGSFYLNNFFIINETLISKKVELWN